MPCWIVQESLKFQFRFQPTVTCCFDLWSVLSPHIASSSVNRCSYVDELLLVTVLARAPSFVFATKLAVRIGRLSPTVVFDAVTRCDRLEHLDIRFAPSTLELHQQPVHFAGRFNAALRDAMSKLVFLRTISLRNTPVTDETACAIAANARLLEELDLNATQITSAALAHIASSLKRLRVLDVSKNDKISDVAIDHLVRNATPISCLSVGLELLSRRRTLSVFSEESVRSDQLAMTLGVTLRSLDLGCGHITQQGVVDGLRCLTSLESLHLTHVCGLTTQQLFTECLSQLVLLSELELQYVSFDDGDDDGGCGRFECLALLTSVRRFCFTTVDNLCLPEDVEHMCLMPRLERLEIVVDNEILESMHEDGLEWVSVLAARSPSLRSALVPVDREITCQELDEARRKMTETSIS